MPRVLLNFVGRGGDGYAYHVHFVEADCRTPIGKRTRYIRFATQAELRAFVLRCTPDSLDDFDQSLRSWGQGSTFVTLTDEQYRKLL